MSDTPFEPTPEMLHAFVDGQLPRADAALVEAWMNANPDAAAEALDWQAQNEAIAALFPAPDDVIPAQSLAPAPANANRAPRLGLIAATCAALAFGLSAGWMARGPAPSQDLIAQAITAHGVYSVDPHRPVEVAAAEEETLVRWLSNRVGTPLSPPDLRNQGFTLVGGRLLSVETGPAAQFLYETDQGNRITLFATLGDTGAQTGFTFNRSADANSFYWSDAQITYALVGDLDRARLNTLAVQVFDQLQ